MPFSLEFPDSLPGFVRSLAAYTPHRRSQRRAPQPTRANEVISPDIPRSLVVVQSHTLQASFYRQEHLACWNLKQFKEGVQLDGRYGLLALFNLSQMGSAQYLGASFTCKGHERGEAAMEFVMALAIEKIRLHKKEDARLRRRLIEALEDKIPEIAYLLDPNAGPPL